jgi:hypothetical protein
VQNVGHYISRDAQMAEVVLPAGTDDPDTVDGTDVFIIYWTEFTSWTSDPGVTPPITSIKHKITYNLTNDGRVIRYHYKNTNLIGGQEHTWDYPAIDEFPYPESVTPIAQFITDCDYNQGTGILTVTASTGGYESKSETREYEVMPRPDEMY